MYRTGAYLAMPEGPCLELHGCEARHQRFNVFGGARLVVGGPCHGLVGRAREVLDVPSTCGRCGRCGMVFDVAQRESRQCGVWCGVRGAARRGMAWRGVTSRGVAWRRLLGASQPRTTLFETAREKIE